MRSRLIKGLIVLVVALAGAAYLASSLTTPAEAQKNPFFAKVLKSQKDFASRAVPHAQKIRPPIEVVVAHYWKK